MTLALALALGLALIALAIAGTLYAGVKVEAGRLKMELEAARSNALEAEAARVANDRALALARQEVEQERSRIGDLDQARKEAVQAAQAAALAASRELSGKLIEDHKREAETQRKEADERVRLATAKMFESFATVQQKVASLNDQVSESKDTVEIVRRALITPGAAGRSAEIGLENTLKAFGLMAGRDFQMQATVTKDESRLRPDALVFMPGDTVLVIDSKASKFLYDAAAAKDEAAAEAARAGLSDSMNKHLKALAAKDYRSAVEADYRRAGRGGELRRIMSLMYLPSDGAIERLQAADAEFMIKAAKAEIIPVGPASLAALIGFARVEIDLGRQAANREQIVEACRALLEALPVAFGHLSKVGKGIKQAADSFLALSGSLNQRLLPRARAIAELGVRPGKELPPPLPSFQVVTHDPGTLIEGESGPPGELPPPGTRSPG